MSMVIKNNPQAMMALRETKKNTSAAAKDLKKLSSGVKIAGAGDDASAYAISEKMRVRIRALGQNEANVKTGHNLLGVALAGIQGQIDLVRRAKQKVIDAANDHNNEDDRATIQKELKQIYEAMSDIAAETDYNTQRVLLGNDYWQTINGWTKLDEWGTNDTWNRYVANGFNEDSDMTGVNPVQGYGLIPDKEATLDGKNGPFDVFKEPVITAVDIPTFGTTVKAAGDNFSGGTDGQPSTVTMNLSMYDTVADLDNTGFEIEGKRYVLTTDMSRAYNYSYSGDYTKINIGGCNTVEDVASAIAATLGSGSSSSGTAITYTTKAHNNAEQSNSVLFKGYNFPSRRSVYYDGARAAVPYHAAVNMNVTGAGFGAQRNLSGGSDGQAGCPYPDTGGDGAPNIPGTKAKLLYQNISGATVPAGFQVHGSGTENFIVVDGNKGFSYDSYLGCYVVGKNASSSIGVAGMTVEISNGSLSFTASSEGSYGNSYYVSDFSTTFDLPVQLAQPAITGTPVYTDYYGVKSIDTSQVSNSRTGTDGTYATYAVDVSAYATDTDLNNLETVINELYGKAICSRGTTVQFGDSTILGTGMIDKNLGGRMVDLNDMRTAVRNGATIGDALAGLLAGAGGTVTLDGNGNAASVVFRAAQIGTAGNAEILNGREGNLRSYDIDFAGYIANNPGTVIPDDFYFKGFRVYCATCEHQWFNFEFTPDFETMPTDYIPESGTDDMDILTLRIDISKATDANSLVEAIYNQVTPIITGQEPAPYFNSTRNYNHYMRLGADTRNGILTIYDERPAWWDLHNTDAYPHAQEKGAKIADGFLDNVIWEKRDIYQNEVHIQDTDKGSQYTKVTIPRTSLDQVFGFSFKYFNMDSFHLLTAHNRYLMLGTDSKKGFFDKGLTYLLDAQTIIGSQASRLEYDANNIITASENTQAAESTIRDADMAREAMNYARDNILSQSAQSMLAQANQNASNVLSLLQ